MKLNVPKNYVYFTYDADGMGRKIGRAVLANDLDDIRHKSNMIAAGHELVKRWVKERDGLWIMGGGDEGMSAIPEYDAGSLEQLRKDYEYLVGATISIGVGKTPSESGTALLMAKLKGKNRIITYNDKAKKEIAKIKRRAKKGIFNSMEEYKIADAYLNKSEEELKDECVYCKQTDGIDPDHCQWCHDLDPQDGEVSCPFCSEEESCPFCQGQALGEEACPFCQESDAPPTQATDYDAPSDTNVTAPSGSDAEKKMYDKMGMNPPAIGKPIPEEESPIGQNAPMDVEPGDDPNQNLTDAQTNVEIKPGTDENTVTIDADDNHSDDALHAIADQIEEEETPTSEQMDGIDDSDITPSSGMEENVSRPQGYEQNTPGDIGIGGANSLPDNDEPNYYNILEEGLDQNAEVIKKEKAIQSISQALMSFKNAKMALENTKMQNPQLYQACLGILKAMIDMAGMLNINGTSSMPIESTLGQEQDSLISEAAPEGQENEWHEPFPAHPDQGGEQKPGHAPPSKKEGESSPQQGPVGGIGQPIGKLPTKQTTAHVARTTMPIGAVNVHGQQKVVDNQGKIRFIDRKNGLVMGPSGVPVKPPKRGNDVSKN